MPSLGERIRSGWNAFIGRDPTLNLGGGYSSQPYRNRTYNSASRTVVNTIYNRIAVDAASIDIKEVIADKERKLKDYVSSGLNDCLCLSANIDQTGRALKQDIIQSMFDEGVVAVVPVDTDSNPYDLDSYDILSLRVGRITQWYPQHVQVELYDERDGMRKSLTLRKDFVAIIENPFYSIMNEYNSTLQRLIRTINLLEQYNGDSVSSKLNLLIQLPYAIKSPARKNQAKERLKDLEDQLTGNKYGIAYSDSTEKITQLNRSLENNLWEQVQALTEQLYNQLGLTAAIFDGTADEATMLNYTNTTLEPVIAAICCEFERKFLTKNARSRGHAILYFNNPFKLVPVNNLAEIADKFTRNEIMSSNEFRAVIGYKPVDDERANELRNKNLNASDEQLQEPIMVGDEGENQNEEQEV